MPKRSPIPAFLFRLVEHRHLIVPVGFLMLIGVLVVPLPTMALDILICGNIALAGIVLLTTIYMRRPWISAFFRHCCLRPRSSASS